MKAIVLAADDRSTVRGGAQVEIGPRGLPDQALVVPAGELLQRLADQRVGILQLAGSALEVALRLVACRKDKLARANAAAAIGRQQHAAVTLLVARHLSAIEDPRAQTRSLLE